MGNSKMTPGVCVGNPARQSSSSNVTTIRVATIPAILWRLENIEPKPKESGRITLTHCEQKRAPTF
jgi:hypothetical protein